MGRLGRRRFLTATGATALTTALGDRAAARSVTAARARRHLVPDPRGILDLPEGFSYRVLQRADAMMSDGYKVPGRPDGMGAFEGPNGSVVLLRNHENLVGDFAKSPYLPNQTAPSEAFDSLGTGGVTRVVVDPKSGEILHSNLVLAGTYWNCAGGPSPWGWLSCEETVDPGHGYVFLCRPESRSVAPAEPIKAYGRFRHEAATVDSDTHIAYLTEDRIDGCFYRFVPANRSEPFAAGKLQALAVKGEPRFLTTNLEPGHRVPVEWVDVDEPDPESDTVRMQALTKGAAVVVRGEGLWLTEREVYICSTAGGPQGLGQIFRLDLASGTLELVVRAEDPRILNMPDNLVVSPHGHVYMAEDGFGQKYVRRLTLDGQVVDFARNAVSLGEFAGPCFSPDGNSMFVNIQDDGLTLHVTGPFDQELAYDRQLSPAAVSATDQSIDCQRGGRGLGSGLAVIALAALVRRRRRRAAAATEPPVSTPG